jgi:hypothetical protein
MEHLLQRFVEAKIGGMFTQMARVRFETRFATRPETYV